MVRNIAGTERKRFFESRHLKHFNNKQFALGGTSTMKIFFLLFVTVHGLIHLLGTAKACGILEVKELTQPISKSAGYVWLVAAVLFLVAAVLFVLNAEFWWMVGLPAVILSQALIFLFWRDAKFGTIANGIIIIPLVISMAVALPGSYRALFRAEAERGIARFQPTAVVEEKDLARLPVPLQKYLRFTGTVGKPRVQNFHATFTGEFCRSQGGGWMDITAEQYNFYDAPTRAFLIRGSVSGVPIDGLHLYKDSSAVMQIRLASLFRVVDARGDTMARSETVTMFNDMCILAPAALLDTSIRWESVDSLTVKGTFTNAGNTVSALLYFNQEGQLTDFSSENRFMSADGVSYKKYRWTTPVRNYKDLDGRKVATEAEATWHLPEGDYVYGKFRLIDIQYNCGRPD